ncbi:hypothetical protein PR202_ga27495 [Eleusine coracana subsp. coracana]|uniref:Uncharacterized protein n=1 Tax=Eleusine coracana subsp. coracana TaxID=191504 RepID=A0AAV5DGM8_ELECO|nr:hypothetical protein QOZ80_8AG0620670 [Eleusine coracana subsp. coracana]GJN09484.1 hypothetical protein PR202_ga27495 [Eleusine coracana subsp. coracana]
MAAVDAIILLIMLAALGFLVPYAKLVLKLSAQLHPATSCVFATIFFGTAVIVTIVVWVVLGHLVRKRGKPRCRGLNKAMEFEGLRVGCPASTTRLALLVAARVRPIELGDEHHELKAELN